MKPYYEDDSVTLWHGDMREVLPTLDAATLDCIVTDPPYGETSLEWDRWPEGWLGVAAATSISMWCFGSLRLFGQRWGAFGEAGWRLSQDIIGDEGDGQAYLDDVTVVWEKHNGSGFATDRFKRVHEHAAHWYHGPWGDVYRDTPRDVSTRTDSFGGRGQTPHTGEIGSSGYQYGQPLARSVIKVRSMHGRALHPTEKPVALLDPLVRYACPEGGTVLDPFAGSGSTAVAARLTGRRAVLVEVNERFCEVIATRMLQPTL